MLHLTPEQIQSGTGLVTTGHGAQISVPEALTLFGDARIFPVLLGNSGEIIAYGSARRIFTEGQRLAMIARDLGCSFPGCTRPPALCQSHHITGYAITRRTTVADGTLLCGFHHREHEDLGWTCQMINGIPTGPRPDGSTRPRNHDATEPTQPHSSDPVREWRVGHLPLAREVPPSHSLVYRVGRRVRHKWAAESFRGARVRDGFGYDDGGFWDDPRRRARAILLILAMTAALIVSIMVFFVGTSKSHRDTGLNDVGPTTQPTITSSHAATATKSSTPASRTSTSAAPKPTSTANPCPSAKPCAVPGDNGGAVAALNKFRASHGLPAVAGSASADAQQCALGQGNGPTCQPHYAWQPVATQDGVQAINKVAQQDGGKWLLDPAMSSFSVGWAYTPGAGGGPGSYQFVVLKVG